MNKAFCEEAQIQERVCSSHHPETNGLTERQNRTLLTGLRKTCETETDWDLACYRVTFAYNIMAKRAHGFIKNPFELMFWREPRLGMGLSDEEITDLTEADTAALLKNKIDEMKKMQDIVMSDCRSNILKEQVFRSRKFR